MTAKNPSPWKRIEKGKVNFYLSADSIISAITLPERPSSKTPTVIRVTHYSPYGRVDSDIFIRLGNPEKPTAPDALKTGSDWQKAKLIEDLLLDNERDEWLLNAPESNDTSMWHGTYETEIQFPKGHHQIEIQLISRVPEVCSIVMANWKVFIR
jgi:hypothetical protein